MKLIQELTEMAEQDEFEKAFQKRMSNPEHRKQVDIATKLINSGVIAKLINTSVNEEQCYTHAQLIEIFGEDYAKIK